MSAADDAFAEAERMIEEARKSGATELSFNNQTTRALTRIPDSIAGLTGLRELDFKGTKISDLSPISGMVRMGWLYLSGTKVSELSPLKSMLGMRWLDVSNTNVSDLEPLAGMEEIVFLWLHKTQVSDLSPLAGMKKIVSLSLHATQVKDPRPVLNFSGLRNGTELTTFSFHDTPFTRGNPQAAYIAEFDEQGKRADYLFDYLRDWLPPGEVETPAPDDLFPILTDGGRLEVAQSLPTEAERDEQLKRVLHERLRDKARDLAQAAGNRFPRLAARARAVLVQVDRDFDDVDLLILHLEIEDLSVRAIAGQEEGEVFPTEVTGPLADVLQIGPGLTLGHPDVETLNDRLSRFRSDPVPADEKRAHDALSAVTAEDTQAIGPRLAELEAQLAGLPEQVALQVQRPVHRNMLWRIGVSLLYLTGSVGLGVATNVVSAAYHAQIVAFAQANWALLMDVAATYSAPFAHWFAASVASVPDLAALSRESLKRLRGRQ